jgi:membrane AbrB-like protein
VSSRVVKFERWPRSLGQGLALLAAGTGGALVAGGIGIPAGAIVGALLASGFYRLAGDKSRSRFQAGAWRERYGRVGRLLLGTFVGAAFGPDVIAPLKAALLPMIVITAIIVGVGLSLGWALGHFTRLDATTAIISIVPGGLPAMVAMAEESEADATVVAAIHFSRLVTILVAVPALVPLLATTSTGTVIVVPVIEPVGFWSTVTILAGGLIAGLLALHVGVPTGDMIGPLLAIGGANLLGAGLGPLTGDLRQVAMLLIGTAVGAQMSRQSLQRLRQIALPAAVVIVMLIAVGLLLGWGLSRVTPLDLATALLSNVPGGASTMPAVAHDLGGDTRLVAALHLTRQLVVFILVPSVLGYLLRGRHQGRIASQKPASNE